MRNKRVTYVSPIAELIKLDVKDVICTSAGDGYHTGNQGEWDEQ